MNRRDAFFQILVPVLYVGLAVVLYAAKQTGLLLLIAIPWSVPLMMLSGLIYHAATDGEQIMSLGSIVGVILNTAIYCYDVQRRRHIRQTTADKQSS